MNRSLTRVLAMGSIVSAVACSWSTAAETQNGDMDSPDSPAESGSLDPVDPGALDSLSFSGGFSGGDELRAPGIVPSAEGNAAEGESAQLASSFSQCASQWITNSPWYGGSGGFSNELGDDDNSGLRMRWWGRLWC